MTSLDAIAHSLSLRSAGPLFRKAAGSPLAGVVVLSYGAPVAPAEAAAMLAGDPDVVWAEPDLLREVQLVPSDLGYGMQWGLHAVRAHLAWDLVTGSANVVVAVIDTGVDRAQPDLQPNLWKNAAEAAGLPGVDDDGNGFVDDAIGWDFVNAPSTAVYPGEEPGPPDNDPGDRHGHGTMCSGIIAAAANESRPGPNMAGVCWHCTVMAVRAGYWDRNGRGVVSMGAWTQALKYATENGARVANLSFGGDTPSALEQEVVEYARRRGVVLVAAAGNAPTGAPLYPAAYPGVVSVAATNVSDEKTSFSNFGAWVDLAAPGQDIYTTGLFPAYSTVSGTSFAAPHVAGAAGLLLSLRPGLTPAAVEDLLKAGADDIDGVNPLWAGALGAGRLNAYRALVAGRLGVTNVSSDPNTAGPLTITGIAVDPNAPWLSFPGPFPVVVGPGDSVWLDATADPSQAPCGLISATATLFSDDPALPATAVDVALRVDCDLDGDGHACAALGGDDCDDRDVTAHPGALEICNGPAVCQGGAGADENCDGAVDEGCSCTGRPNAPALDLPIYADGEILLGWRDLSDNETGFRILRRKGHGDWRQIGRTGPDATFFRDPNVVPGRTYTYGVKAYNRKGASARVTTLPITILRK